MVLLTLWLHRDSVYICPQICSYLHHKNGTCKHSSGLQLHLSRHLSVWISIHWFLELVHSLQLRQVEVGVVRAFHNSKWTFAHTLQLLNSGTFLMGCSRLHSHGMSHIGREEPHASQAKGKPGEGESWSFPRFDRLLPLLDLNLMRSIVSWCAPKDSREHPAHPAQLVAIAEYWCPP